MSPSVISLISTFLLTFFGINLVYIKKLCSKYVTLNNLLKNPEVYLNYSLLKFFGKTSSLFILIAFLALEIFLYTKFATYKLPDRDKYVYYINDKLIEENKVYYYDIDKIKIYLKEAQDLNSNQRIQIGALEYKYILPFIGNLEIRYADYYYCEDCLLCVKTKYSAKEIVEDTINSNDVEKSIHAKLKGKNNFLEYIKSDTTFCFKHNNILNASFCEIFDSLLFYTVQSKKNIIKKYSDLLADIETKDELTPQYLSFFDTLKINFVNDFNKTYVEDSRKIKNKYPSNKDILEIYDNIVNYTYQFSLIKPFYKGGGFETFTRLIEILILFESTKEQIDKNSFHYEIIGEDFLSYVNSIKGINQIEGRILRTFAIIFCYIESPSYQPKYKSYFSIYISDAIKTTNIYNHYIDKEKNINYNSQVHLFLRYLYEESARFNIPFENNNNYEIFKIFQKDLKKSNLKEKLSYIRDNDPQINKGNISKYIQFVDRSEIN